jgi:hypothetical protein
MGVSDGCFDGRAARTRVVADHRAFAAIAVAVAQNTKVDAAIGSEGNGLDDGRGQRGQQQQTEGDKEQDG